MNDTTAIASPPRRRTHEAAATLDIVMEALGIPAQQRRHSIELALSDGWIPLRTAATAAGISPRTLHRWIGQGGIRHRPGVGRRATMVCWADVLRHRQQQGSAYA